MDYIIHISIMVCIYSILGMSFNLTWGYTGLLSLAYAAFYGIGAYITALIALNFGNYLFVSILAAFIFSALSSMLIAVSSLRLSDDYYVIATFAFQTVIVSVLNAWRSVTGGPMGLSGIPEPIILGFPTSSSFLFFLFTLLISLSCFFVIRLIVTSPFGRVLKAVREDEVLTQANGKSILRFKITATMLGCGMAAISGSLYAYHISIVDPSSFSIMESIFIISIVVIGGAGGVWGPILGAFLLVVLPEVFLFLGFPEEHASNYREILYGGALVAFLLWRPQGLLGDDSFSRSENNE